MAGETHEQAVNNTPGEILRKLRRAWRLRTGKAGQVLVEEAGEWPVAPEAKLGGHTGKKDIPAGRRILALYCGTNR